MELHIGKVWSRFNVGARYPSNSFLLQDMFINSGLRGCGAGTPRLQTPRQRSCFYRGLCYVAPYHKVIPSGQGYFMAVSTMVFGITIHKTGVVRNDAHSRKPDTQGSDKQCLSCRGSFVLFGAILNISFPNSPTPPLQRYME